MSRPGATSVKTSKDGGHLYEQVASELAGQIRRENLRPGDRCPSIRQVCRQFQVSLATAVQALGVLERQGLVEARPQSGYFVRATVPKSALLTKMDGNASKIASRRVETSEFVGEAVSASRDPQFAPMGGATMAPSLLPLAALQRAFVAAARDLGPDALLYELPAGNEDLRRQIARRMAHCGCEISADDVVVTSGGMEAIHIALCCVAKPGDTVAIETPIFFGILELVAALDLKVVPIPTHPQTGLDVGVLAKVMNERPIAAVIAIPNYNNPVGGRMPDEAKRALVDLVSKAGVALIEDDVYGELFHAGARPLAAKSYDETGSVIYCSSFSKTLSPGLRLGWAVPGKYREAYERRKAVSTLASPTWSQSALADYLSGDAYDRHLQHLRRILGGQIQQYIKAVLEFFPKGTKVSQPEGGYILWVQLPPGVDSLALFESARAKRISIIPGPAFSPEKGRFGDFIRISCSYPLNKTMTTAIRTLGRLVGECGK